MKGQKSKVILRQVQAFGSEAQARRDDAEQSRSIKSQKYNSKIKSFTLFVLVLSFALCALRFPKGVFAAAYLSLSPTAQSVEVGESFDVDVVLNTGNSNTDAADVIINYDSAKLTLTAATLNDLYDNRLVSNTSVVGKVTLRATASAGNYFNGTGTFATLSFTGKAIGTASVSFDFSASSTTDSNVAYSGSDILGSVANGSYQVVAAGTLTSAPTRAATIAVTQPVTGGLTPTVTLGIFGTFFLVLGALAILF